MRSTPPVGSRVTRCTTVDTWMSYSWEHGVQVDEIADLHALRVEILGEEDAAALFARDEAVDAVALDRLELASREDLAPDERERHLAAVEADLPPAERARRRESQVALDLRRVEAEALEPCRVGIGVSDVEHAPPAELHEIAEVLDATVPQVRVPQPEHLDGDAVHRLAPPRSTLGRAREEA